MWSKSQTLLYFCSATALCLSTTGSVAAFVSRPNGTPLQTTSLKAHNKDARKSRGALNFPPLDPVDEEKINDYVNAGISPRMARIVSPLRALLAMPLVLNMNPSPAAAAPFDEAVSAFFPKAMPSSTVVSAVSTVLSKRAKAEDTLFGTSICPDEVNTKPGQKSLATALQDQVSKQNGVFTLGGLAGLPFVGVSGMQAFLSHCPGEGRVVIFFGPHVGVSNSGVIGKVERLGKGKPSGACGASVGAYKVIIAEEEIAEEKAAAQTSSASTPITLPPVIGEAPSEVLATRQKLINDLQKALDKIAAESSSLEEQNAKLKQKYKKRANTADFQEEFLIDRLRPTLKNVEFADDNRAITYVTKQVYTFIQDMLDAELKYCWKDPKFWDSIEEVTLIGGILINRGQFPGQAPENSEDYFQPLKFETYTYDGGIRKLDLYNRAFGKRPLSYSLMSNDDY